MPRGKSKRMYPELYSRRKKKNAPRKEHPATAFINDDTVDLYDKVSRAHNLIMDGMAHINEGHDIINSIPKRK